MNGLEWGNPFAFFGAAALAIPVLVHLLAAYRARRIPFPTLRFLPESMPTALRAHRLDDRSLLALRCLIFVLVVLALARPSIISEGGQGSAGEGVALAVVIDNSASMRRDDGGGESALDAARALAVSLTESVVSGMAIESADLASGVLAAQAWLTRALQDDGGSAEIVVISDFQSGSIAAGDLSAALDTTGIRLAQIAVPDNLPVRMPALSLGDLAWEASATLDEEATQASWQADAATVDAGRAGSVAVEMLAGDREASAARAAAGAARQVVPVPLDAPRRAVTIVWPQAPERSSLLAAATAPDEPWMADVLAATPEGSATGASHEGRLLLFARVEPGSLASAALVAALRRSEATPIAGLGELETTVLADEVLRAWERPTAPVPGSGTHLSRWLWLAAICLLFLEQVVRRDRRPVPSTPGPASTPLRAAVNGASNDS